MKVEAVDQNSWHCLCDVEIVLCLMFVLSGQKGKIYINSDSVWHAESLMKMEKNTLEEDTKLFPWSEKTLCLIFLY